jgi:hydrogenase/urease accessory protein HupE
MRRFFALALLAAPAAAAHQPTVSYSELAVRGSAVEGTLRFSLADLRGQLQLDPAALPAAALSHLLLEAFMLKAQGEPCALQPGAQAHLDGEDGIALLARWSCPREIEVLEVRAGFLDSFPTGHTHLARVTFGPDEVSQRVAQANDAWFEVRRSRAVAHEAGRFLLLGIEHIFTGYDHIAFLIGLLLLGGALRELVKIVTAFTVAHSITLALAALDLLSPSPRVIEPLIAASIVFVGLEDFWALRRGREGAALRHRWLLTSAFGLVHGFGFAAVLRELQLPRAVLATGLVSFNLGVEVGQVCIVLVALPLIRRLRAWPPFAPAASACIALLGGFWLLQRLFG